MIHLTGYVRLRYVTQLTDGPQTWNEPQHWDAAAAAAAAISHGAASARCRFVSDAQQADSRPHQPAAGRGKGKPSKRGKNLVRTSSTSTLRHAPFSPCQVGPRGRWSGRRKCCAQWVAGWRVGVRDRVLLGVGRGGESPTREDAPSRVKR